MTSVALCACLSVTAAEQESREKYEAQFQLERDPVAKAKILAKWGRLEIDQARADLLTSSATATRWRARFRRCRPLA